MSGQTSQLPDADRSGRRLLSGEHDRLYPVLFGCVLRGSFAEPKPTHDARTNPLEPRPLEQLKELSLRESTANSAGPELRVVHDRLGERAGADNVND